MLINLDDDALLEIIARLDLKSIVLGLRKVNKRLYALSKARSLWSNAVTTLLKDHRLPTSVYPIQSMEQVELEKAVINPVIFSEKLGSAETSTTPIALRSSVAFTAPNLGEHVMVPGGRWLITGHRAGSIYLWDLEEIEKQRLEKGDTDESSHLTPITKLHLSSYGVDRLQLQADPITGGAILLVVSEGQGDPPDWDIVRIDFPAESAPTLSRAASVRGKICAGTQLLWGDYVVSYCFGKEGSVVLWNWRDDTWAGIKDLELDAGELGSASPTSIQGPYVTLATNHAVFRTYLIPPFNPLPEDDHPYPYFESTKPVSVTREDKSLGPNMSVPRTMSRWIRDDESAAYNPITLRCPGRMTNTTGEFAVFMPNAAVDNIPQPPAFNFRHQTDRYSGEVVSQVIHDGKSNFTTYLVNKTLYAVVSPVTPPTSGVDVKTLVLADEAMLNNGLAHVDLGPHSWDPISGKVCVKVGWGNIRVFHLV